MENFRIAAELVTPIIVNTLTLDGLLGAVLFDELQGIERAYAQVREQVIPNQGGFPKGV